MHYVAQGPVGLLRIKLSYLSYLKPFVHSLTDILTICLNNVPGLDLFYKLFFFFFFFFFKRDNFCVILFASSTSFLYWKYIYSIWKATAPMVVVYGETSFLLNYTTVFRRWRNNFASLLLPKMYLITCWQMSSGHCTQTVIQTRKSVNEWQIRAQLFKASLA